MSQNVARSGAGLFGLVSAALALTRGRKHPLRETGQLLAPGTRVDAWRWRNCSKYTPHQGKRECQRRRDQFARRQIIGFVVHESWCAVDDDAYSHCNCGAPLRRSL